MIWYLTWDKKGILMIWYMLTGCWLNSTPLKNVSSSAGITIPKIWTNKKWSKAPTRFVQKGVPVPWTSIKNWSVPRIGKELNPKHQHDHHHHQHHHYQWCPFGKIERLVWYPIYHHLPVLKGQVSNPSVNQPTEKGHLWSKFNQTCMLHGAGVFTNICP